MSQNWNPNQFGPPPGVPGQAPVYPPAQPAAPQGHAPGYAPPGAPYAGQPAPAPYAGPGAAPGYAAPPAGGFRPVAPTSLDDRTPDLPRGDHVLVCEGAELVGQNRDLLVVHFQVEQSNTAAPGTKGAWKRSLKQTQPYSAQAASNDIAKLVVPMSGRPKDTTDLQSAFALVSEFLATFTLDRRPIAGLRVGATVADGNKINAKTGRPWPVVIFHTL